MPNNDNNDEIRPNPRNFWGTMIFLFGLVLYSFAAAAVGDLLKDWNTALQMVWYGFAGLVWIFPAKHLFAWMAKGQNHNK